MFSPPESHVTWLLIAVVSALAAIIGFIIKVITGQVINRLDEIVTELRQLTHITTIQKEQIKSLQERDISIRRRLYSHAERLRALELHHLRQPDKA